MSGLHSSENVELEFKILNQRYQGFTSTVNGLYLCCVYLCASAHVLPISQCYSWVCETKQNLVIFSLGVETKVSLKWLFIFLTELTHFPPFQLLQHSQKQVLGNFHSPAPFVLWWQSMTTVLSHTRFFLDGKVSKCSSVKLWEKSVAEG